MTSLVVLAAAVPVAAVAAARTDVAAVGTSPGTVPLDQIHALLTNLQTVLGGIEQTLESKVFAVSLPLLGNVLGSDFAGNVPALTDFQSFEQAVLGALGGFSAAATADQIQSAIDGAIAHLGLTGDAGGVTVSYVNQTLTAGFADAFTASFKTNVGSSLGLPGLGLTTSGSVQAALGYTLAMTAAVGAIDAFSLTAPKGALSLSLNVAAPSFAADATLGFVKYTVTDEGSSLSGTFTLDTSGNATFVGSGAIHVALQSDLGNALLPSVHAQLDVTSAFTQTNGVVNPATPTSFGSMPTASLSNVTYDFGSVIDNFLSPLMTQLNELIAPIRPALEVLDADLPLVRDALGDHWKSLDTSGALDASGNNAPDGKLSLLDFLAQPTGDPSDTPAFVKLVDVLNLINNFSEEFAGRTGSPSTPFDLGTFSLPTDLRDAAKQLAKVVPILTGNSEDLKAIESQLGDDYPGKDDNTGQSDGADISDLLNNTDFSFPLLEKPVTAVEAMLGANVDLFDLKVSPTFLGVGSFNDDGSVQNTQTILAIPIEVPPIPISITPALGAAIGASIGIDIGFDTSGLQAFAQDGFKTPGEIAQGLYIENPGPTDPILRLEAALQLSATVATPGFSVEAEGGIDGNVDVSLKNSGKTYVYSFLSTLANDPTSVFNIAGRLGGDVGIKVSAFGADFSIRTPDFTIFSAGTDGSSGGVAPPPPPRQSATWNNPGLFGYLEVPSNWTFEQDPSVPGGPEFFGDTTIQANTSVEYRGTVTAVDMTSLTVGQKGALQLDSNTVRIDGRASNARNNGIAYASENDGTVTVTGTADLVWDGSVTNTGTIKLGLADNPGAVSGLPSISVSELLYLTGGGTVLAYGAAVWQVAGGSSTVHTGAAELWNADNTIEGGGQFDLQVLNEGTIDANSSAGLTLNGPVINRGLIEATLYRVSPIPAGAGLTLAGGAILNNSHGTITAGASSTVYIGTGTTIQGGALTAALEDALSFSFAGEIQAQGQVTLDGGTAGLDVEGDVEAVDALTEFGAVGTKGLLTLTGLITGTPYATLPGGTLIRSGGDADLVLSAATLRGGELAATGSGLLRVATAATLDGSAGPGAVALDGTLHVDSATLTVVGGLVPVVAGTEIDLTGATLVIGGPTDDGAILGAGPSDPATRGTLLLDNFAVSAVIGYSNDSKLSNSWLIAGTGVLGDARIAITNTAAGVIEAIDAGLLTVDGGANTLVNHGLLLAAAGSRLALNSAVNNAGGVVTADGGGVILGAADAMTLAGGQVTTAHGGTVTVGNGTTLDGTAQAVTLTAGAKVVLGFAQTFTGAIVNATTLTLSAGLLGSTSTLTLAGTARLSGGGTLLLADPSGHHDADTQIVAGPLTTKLDNADNLIEGLGRLGAGTTGLVNEAAGTIAASGGTLYVAPFGTLTNAGLLEGLGGTLDLTGTVANTGTIGAHNDGSGHSGAVVLDSLVVQGGTLDGDATDAASVFTENGTASVLDGTAAAVTLTAAAQVQLAAGNTLTLKGAIADSGAIALAAPSTGSGKATLFVSGKVVLSGGGAVSLSDAAGKGGSADQVITGATSADTLDDAGVTITGSGQLGAGLLNIINEAGGTVSANAGKLAVRTYNGSLSNAGLLTSLTGGTLDLRPDVANTGTIAAAGGTTLLDNDTVTGGTFAGSTGGQVLGTYATIDGTTSAVTLTAGAVVGVNTQAVSVATHVTLKGSFINEGELLAEGTTTLNPAELIVSGSLRLTGGGQVVLDDLATSQGYGSTELIGDPGTVPATYGSNTFDNAGNTIKGTGLLGNASLAIINESAGVIAAEGGILRLNTLSSNSIATKGNLTNAGVVEALGGTLDLSATVDDAGGQIRALNDGAGHSGIVILDNAVVHGGTLASDASDAASYITAQGGTLDGGTSAVTLAAGTPLHVAPRGSLTLKGSIVNLGTVSIQADGVNGAGATVHVAGTVRLSGGGAVAMSDLSATGDAIKGASGTDLLDNADNTIAGFGRLGFGTMSLLNESGGTIAGEGGTLYVSPGGTGSTWANKGLMEGLGGTLDLQGVVANAGGTIAARRDAGFHSGQVTLNGVTIQGGTIDGDAADAGSMVTVAATGNTLDGTASAVTLTAQARLQVGPSDTLVLKGSIVDAGTIAVATAGANFYYQATLQASGTVTLGGGGTVALTDTSGSGESSQQIVTGVSAADTLDNTGVTISGTGQLGAGGLTFVNDTGGTVVAAGATLVVDTGAGTFTNRGMLGAAAGATLDVKSNIANAGGIVAPDAGVVLLDGGTLAGGTIGGGAHGGMVLGYGGTIDGTVSAVTIAAGAVAGVVSTVPNPYLKQLTLKGAIVNRGTLLVQGDDTTAYPNQSDLLISGTVILSGGGTVSLAGANTADTGRSTKVIGATGADTLENVDNVIAGHGSIGTSTLRVVDDTAGVIRAQGGTLDIQGPISGAGTLAVADGATLQLDRAAGSGLTIDFVRGGTHESVVLGTPLAALASLEDFAAGDSITFSGNYRAVNWAVANDVMTITGDGSTVATLDFLGGYTAANTHVVDAGGTVTVTTSVACYAAGTRIQTSSGEVPVETLTEGDEVVMLSGDCRPVRWIGRRSYAGRFLAANPAVQPVRIRAGALGVGLPRRDLLVSPDHAMFLDGMLVPARHLVNGISITRECMLGRIDYFHVELDEHDIILAEGAPAESFVDDDSRGTFHNAIEWHRAHPGAAKIGPDYCAPRIESGQDLEAIRRRLATLAPAQTQLESIRICGVFTQR